jgi:glutamyl-tRNA synthetase
MILRLDDTDVERNTQQSIDSIFDGLRWLSLDWDEYYRQSDRLQLHEDAARAILAKGLAYRDFTPMAQPSDEKPAEGGGAAWLCNPEMRALSTEESDRRAAACEPFVIRYRVPRESGRIVRFVDEVYGEQAKSTADIEDFALLRSNGLPTYHMASCADDADLKISHIIRGQDHLTNTFKHVLIFEALGYESPKFAHLPLLIAPDGAKLSKRKHGPVVSVTTYRDAGFLAHAYVNFLCLLGWSPKDDRERMSREELVAVFGFEGVNRSNAVVNFSDEDPLDPKALWLNSQHIYAMPVPELAALLKPVLEAAGYQVHDDYLLRVTPLIQERIKTLNDAPAVADFFFQQNPPTAGQITGTINATLGPLVAEATGHVQITGTIDATLGPVVAKATGHVFLPPDPAELIPQKGDAAMARRSLERALVTLETAEFTHDGLDAALRAAATELGVKAGQMFQPIRVAVCGRKNAPPLFETLEVLGRDVCLPRIRRAIELIDKASV